MAQRSGTMLQAHYRKQQAKTAQAYSYSWKTKNRPFVARQNSHLSLTDFNIFANPDY
jgi:hypothetical protein